MILFEFLLAGFVLDLLITVGWYSLEKKWIIGSTLSAIAQTWLGYTVFYNLLPEGGFSLQLINFAIGGGIAVALVVAIRKYYSKEK